MKKILITGGAGFIGCNAALYFNKIGWQVRIFDNLSRIGTDRNLAMLFKHGIVDFVKGDLRDFEILEKSIVNFEPDVILHLAGQVAVTTSVQNPMEDFQINALGTINLLEALRLNKLSPLVIYSSTNKVYGGMENLEIVKNGMHYQYADLVDGVSEDRQLDFHSPYGCSKGAADQYIRDYSRIYGIPGVVLRQSCIYGPNQFGIEDQGWVAWFTIAASFNRNITIFGDGMQIRDVLHIDDLLKLYEKCASNPKLCDGEIFNVGGGPENIMSLLELIGYLEKKLQIKVDPRFADWRPGDQKVYISNTAKAKKILNWQPAISPKKGVEILADWVSENKENISEVIHIHG